MEGCNHVPLSQDGHHVINAIGLPIFRFKAFSSRNYTNAHSSKIEKASISCVSKQVSLNYVNFFRNGENLHSQAT